MSNSEICFLSACQLLKCIESKQLSAVEVVKAHLSQIESINPKVNAIVTLVADQALAQAKTADESLHKGQKLGPLHGLPVAHKDTLLTKGILTTHGSSIYKDFIPTEDTLMVERIKRAGAITIGKTNVPELGAGSQTYNPLFGETLNPYDTTKTCGGSSGGSAVALACGMVPIANGDDMGGSLRNPASFCNVVGFRPSPGRVPTWPTMSGWNSLTVQGPMARTVEDTALMLSVISGYDSRSPIANSDPGKIFKCPLNRDYKGVRIAWSENLNGLPVDSSVTDAINVQKQIFEDLGCVVEHIDPDFKDADDIFKVMRAMAFELSYSELIDEHEDQIKDTVVWNIREGQKISGSQVAKIERKRTDLYHRIRRFMETYEFLILPVSQVPPFDVNERYVKKINNIQMETYIDWMKSCYFITTIGNPAISVPCGFTPEGLPIGMQIVGRQHDDFGVLQLAYAFEQATEFWKQKPAIVDIG